MNDQPDINERFVSILMDWIVDIHNKFEFNNDILY